MQSRIMTAVSVAVLMVWMLPPVVCSQAGDSGESRSWEFFELSEIMTRREQSGRAYLDFLKVPSLHVGLYMLAAKSEDRQRPHREDEVYHVTHGRGRFKVGDQDREVRPGSIIFVKADVEHRFHSIEEDLQVIVFFSSAPTHEKK